MKKIFTIAMAALFLTASLGLAQDQLKVRKHTRPPYSGPKKPVDKSKLRGPHFMPKSQRGHKKANSAVPSGSITVR